MWFANESEQVSSVLFASPVLIAVYGIIGISVAVLCLRNYPLDIRALGEYFFAVERKGREKDESLESR